MSPRLGVQAPPNAQRVPSVTSLANLRPGCAVVNLLFLRRFLVVTVVNGNHVLFPREGCRGPERERPKHNPVGNKLKTEVGSVIVDRSRLG